MDWQQISFEVQKSEVDLISEVLVGLGSLSITFKDAQDNDIYEPPVGTTPLWEKVTVAALFSSEMSKDYVEKTILEICDINISNATSLKDKVWEKECQKDFPAMQFGKKLWVCPSWDIKPELSTEDVVIMMDPGLAFGTGTHQTTSLCLEYLDENPPVNLDVIDFGCGTGILAIAAAKLKAKSILAIDNDPQAVIASHENVITNRCEEVINTIHSMDQDNSSRCDLLIANILANPIIELEPLFSEFLKSNGTILLSGIIKDQVKEVVSCYSQNFTDIKLANKDEWYRISATRKFS
ncbi:50S ribosomal protein L11 methyltransferase [Candidatus Pseudothioglobus singularis]|nr:50S ribosomal protein L11 methyltransferase [Candidatus Pseudothioglobus singularis]